MLSHAKEIMRRQTHAFTPQPHQLPTPRGPTWRPRSSSPIPTVSASKSRWSFELQVKQQCLGDHQSRDPSAPQWPRYCLPASAGRGQLRRQLARASGRPCRSGPLGDPPLRRVLHQRHRATNQRCPTSVSRSLSFKTRRFELKINPRTGLIDHLSLAGSRKSLVGAGCLRPAYWADLDHSWTSGSPRQRPSLNPSVPCRRLDRTPLRALPPGHGGTGGAPVSTPGRQMAGRQTHSGSPPQHHRARPAAYRRGGGAGLRSQCRQSASTSSAMAMGRWKSATGSSTITATSC